MLNSLKVQIEKTESKLKREVAKMVSKDELHEVTEIANTSRQIANNVRQEINVVAKKFKERAASQTDESSKKVDELRKELKNDLKIFIKNNANSGLIKSLEEVRTFAADIGERVDIIEDAIDEMNKAQELPNISRSSSKISLSKLSRSESRGAPPDMSPFLGTINIHFHNNSLLILFFSRC